MLNVANVQIPPVPNFNFQWDKVADLFSTFAAALCLILLATHHTHRKDSGICGACDIIAGMEKTMTGAERRA